MGTASESMSRRFEENAAGNGKFEKTIQPGVCWQFVFMILHSLSICGSLHAGISRHYENAGGMHPGVGAISMVRQKRSQFPFCWRL
jgi:hypothetical protein